MESPGFTWEGDWINEEKELTLENEMICFWGELRAPIYLAEVHRCNEKRIENDSRT